MLNVAVTPGLSFLTPRNFSGRSAYLKKWTGEAAPAVGIYIGEFPFNYISGLATTVADELRLHQKHPEHSLSQRCLLVIDELGFQDKMDRTPFSLSGGEQAILVVICALLLHPQRLAIDIALEQLSKNWRHPLMALIGDFTEAGMQAKICDNRISELGGDLVQIEELSHEQTDVADPRFGDILFTKNELQWQTGGRIDIKALSFAYTRNKPVLNQCNYSFSPGHIYHLKGLNGAGKSTLSKILCGLYKPSSGTVSVGGHPDLYRYPGQAIGYNFQNVDEQLFRATVREELLQSNKRKDESFQQIFQSIPAMFGLTDLIEEHPADLPFVLRKRISIAGTIINERPWYIFDEPSIGQDDLNLLELATLIKYLSAQGKGIIVISHSNSFINLFENITVVTLEGGQLV